MINITIPNQKAVESTILAIFDLLFPVNHPDTNPEVPQDLNDLQQKMLNVLSGLTEDKEAVCRQFLAQLPEIRKVLVKDADFMFESDPAATEVIEVIAIYPGFFALFCYRIAHFLAGLGVNFLPRMIAEYAHRISGIDIHPLASIGSPFSIDHGTGIVIGATAVIGKHVKIYQGVTLGALSVEKSTAAIKRHPSIEDHCVLYAGCTILGGETVVGRNSVIGGNVWLTSSIAPFSVVYHKSEILVRNHHNFQEPVNFII